MRGKGGMLGRVVVCVALLALTACATPKAELVEPAVNTFLSTKAVAEAQARRSRGERIWCVPFARTMSGIDLQGNAQYWFANAEGVYDRGHEPEPGAVMVWAGGSGLTAGHVAVVTQELSDREIEVDHANWHRNQVSLGMRVVDVSETGDWSAVRVESTEGALGRTYRIKGFVYPRTPDGSPDLTFAGEPIPSTPTDG
jgi:surface antigen